MSVIRKLSTRRPVGRSERLLPCMSHLLVAIAGTVFATAGFSEDLDTAGWQNKLRFHAENAYGVEALANSLTYAGFLQEINSPKEWGEGGIGYGNV